MPIVPDTKDWTWVLERPCPECGFDTRAFPREQVGQLLRDNAAQWQQLLRQADDAARRPTPDKWSLLEYACHVRDVFRRFDERLVLMLTHEGPLFANWDQDETAEADRYAEQEPQRVATEIASAVEPLADRVDSVTGGQWSRTGIRSDGAHFTVESLARYLLHDPVHHLSDVGAGR
jgi:hypothetical protein